MSSDVKRRYQDFKPEKYEITIEPNQDELTFRGMVDISGRLAKNRKNITLHAKDLDFESVHLTQGNKTIELVEARTSRATQEANLIFKEMINAGLAHLHIEFEGEITENMHGLYRSKYETGDGVEYLLATQMEANHAREVFPCVDEPEAKSTFNLTLLLPEGTKAISNTPVADTKTVEDKTFISFETTPEMSTYLLAFVVGELESKSATSKNGTEVRVYATEKNQDHTDFALETAVKVLDFYNDYFDIPYPLEKLDLAAIPDFAAGAMENWGLVTFREEALLVDEKNTSLSAKQYVAEVIAHELAHQWFGNLVTMRWWNDLWLNESFATWISYLAIDELFPKWKMWEQFISNDYAVAQRSDCLANTHPIQVEVDDPDEINEIFDEISYEKGASVIRMLHEYLGADDFQQGLHKYLKKFSHDNTVTTDLWNALQKSSGKPVVKFMSKWTEEEGFPMVWFEPSEDEDKEMEYTFHQERFVLSPIERGNTGELEFWPIPITIVGHEEQVVSRQAFEDHQLEEAIETPKLNQGQVGFYRAQYNSDQLDNLADSIKNGKLEALDRYGVVDDTFEMAKAGYLSAARWLELLENFEEEENLIVWDSIAHGLLNIHQLFDEDTQGLLQQFGRDLLAQQVERLGWKFSKKDSHFDRLLRPQILGLAARFQDEDVLETIQDKYDAHREGDKVHPDLRSVVYSGLARKKNTKTAHNQMKKMYKNTDSPEEKKRLAAAMCAFEDEEIFERSLAMIRGGEVRLQEVMFWLIFALRNRHNYQLAWEWLKTEDNWDWYTDKFRDTHQGPRVVKSIASAAASEDLAEEVEEFFDENGYSGIDRSVDQTVERIHLQAEWVDRDQEEIKEYLAEKLGE